MTPPDLLHEIVAARLPVLDFDGTIARLAVDWDALRADLARRSGVDFSGGLDAGLRAVRDRDPPMFRQLCDVVSDAEIAGFADVRDDIFNALHGRFARPWAVFSSNTHRALLHLLGVLRLSPRMVIGKESVRRGKPDPEGLLFISAALGPVDLFVGDSAVDLEAGRAAGVRTLLVTPWEEA